MHFSDVVGQEHITTTLQRAIEKKRIAHAYIFSGTRGVGKTTTARILARALNCDNGPTTQPCGICESCKNIISGASFDVIEIDGASNNGVDNIRELRENVGYTSMGGKYRIFVIDEVHMLTKGAFNALLKTLEEPPQNVIFIFATTEPQKIPDTIHSRCQRFDFRRISTEQIYAHLAKICTQEQIPFEKNALYLVAQKGEGSLRDCLSLLDQVYSFCPDSIREQDVRMVLGLVRREVYETVLQAIIDKNPAAGLTVVEEVLTAGFDLAEFVAGLTEYIRQLLFARIPGVAGLNQTHSSQEATTTLSASSQRFSEGDLIRFAELLRKTESELKWSSASRFLIELTLLKMIYMDRTVTMERLMETLSSANQNSLFNPTDAGVEHEAKKKKLSPPALHESICVVAPTEPSDESIRVSASQPDQDDATSFDIRLPHTDPATIATQWARFLEFFIEDRPNLGTFLSLARFRGSTESSVDVRFDSMYGFQFSELTKKTNHEYIKSKLTAFFKRPVEPHITIEKSGSEPAKNQTDASPLLKAVSPSLEDDEEKEPIIRRIVELFDCEQCPG
ncbi:MAG: DNA polymerase III subunit gamma/tau [Chitinivibrionales bacterium]|nr:DNA polymerase III subunit gamma/tau [Chitinivibrionales bacterium]